MARFCQNHQNLLQYKGVSSKTVNSLSRAVKDIPKLLDPIDAFKNKMSHENIATEQRKFATSIYNKCLASQDFTINHDDLKYRLSNGLIYVQDRELFKILLLPSLEGLFLSYLYLAHGHAGVLKRTAMLFP